MEEIVDKYVRETLEGLIKLWIDANDLAYEEVVLLLREQANKYENQI